MTWQRLPWLGKRWTQLTILGGEVLRDPKNGSRIFWNRQVSYPAFPNDLGHVLGHDCVRAIWCDRRRKEVRIFGPLNERERIAKEVLQFFAETGSETLAVPISSMHFEQILLKGRGFLEKLIILLPLLRRYLLT
jgi:hypothetical protein